MTESAGAIQRIVFSSMLSRAACATHVRPVRTTRCWNCRQLLRTCSQNGKASSSETDVMKFIASALD